MRRRQQVTICIGLVAASAAVAQPLVPAWRNGGTGQYPEATPPTVWSADSNVVWKTPLAKWSNASPIIVGDRIFVCAEPATLVCISLSDGHILWERPNGFADVCPPEEADALRAGAAKGLELQARIAALKKDKSKADSQLKKTPDDAALKEKSQALQAEIGALDKELKPLLTFLPPPTNGSCGYSSPTPVSDGQNVYVLSGLGVLAAYKLDGERLWAVRVDASKSREDSGHSASPILLDGKLVVHLTSLHAFEAATGKELWKTPASPRWGTPVHARIGAEDVIIDGNGNVVRLSDGKILAPNLCPLAYNGPAIESNVVYFIQHKGKAIKLPDTTAEPFKPEVLWTTTPKDDRYYSVPAILDGRIYAVSQRPMFNIIDQDTGNVSCTNRLKLGDVRAYTSVTRAGDYLYFGNDNGTMVVFKPAADFQPVATNKVEAFRSTPVFQGSRMYLRTLKNLYCIGK